MKYNNILFITLKVFSATGGIEKVCRIVGKALFEYGIETNTTVQIYTMHGNIEASDGNRYFPSEIVRNFDSRRIRCIIASLRKGYSSKTVMISHINLLVIGWLIKIVSPSTKLVLFVHGIEVWSKLSWMRKQMLKSCDEFIAVSHFTSEKMTELHQVPKVKIRVINNCLDPFLPLLDDDSLRENLRKRYGFKNTDIILFTLTRLSAKERYKGYDNVMHSMVNLVKEFPSIRYLLAGSYDTVEKLYLDKLITKLGLSDNVVMTGFVSDDELSSHFSMADIYVMPSMKEGFGIVFIEAMYYGLPVIAGNRDGSVDALCNGELGLLVDPLDIDAIRRAIEKMISDKTSFIPDRNKLMRHFSYDNYKIKLESLITSADIENLKWNH